MSETRCPACNPIHGSLALATRHLKAKKHRDRKCTLCQGSALVALDVATRFLNAIRGWESQPTWSQLAMRDQTMATHSRDK